MTAATYLHVHPRWCSLASESVGQVTAAMLVCAGQLAAQMIPRPHVRPGSWGLHTVSSGDAARHSHASRRNARQGCLLLDVVTFGPEQRVVCHGTNAQ